jgi:hypothetical protein
LDNELGNIIRTRNKDLATLALEAYYKSNEFYVFLSRRYMVEHPPRHFGKYIKRLEALVGEPQIHDTLEDMFSSYRNGWRCLLTPTRPLDIIVSERWDVRDMSRAPIKTDWQAYFPNLRELTISISPLREPCHRDHPLKCSYCGFSPHRIKLLKEHLEETRIGIKAIRVKTVMFRKYGWIGPVCVCMRSLEELVTRMATK